MPGFKTAFIAIGQLKAVEIVVAIAHCLAERGLSSES